MKLALTVLGASALSAVALVSVAIAQPPGRGPGGLAGFALLQHDANGDGRLTRAEFDAAQKARFDTFDVDKDGSATPDEIRSQQKAHADEWRVSAMTERFDALDADKSGQLSRVEFSAGPAAGDRDIKRGVPDRRRGPDRDGAGPGKRINAGGTLTLAEFTARGAESFARADANKDGAVTVTELQSLSPQRP